jgi:hypothetical protein
MQIDHVTKLIDQLEKELAATKPAAKAAVALPKTAGEKLRP